MSDVVDEESGVIVVSDDVVELEVSNVDIVLLVNVLERVESEDELVVEPGDEDRKEVVVEAVLVELGKLSRVEVELIVVEKVDDRLENSDDVEVSADVVAVVGRMLDGLLETVVDEAVELVLVRVDAEELEEVV